MHSYVGITFVVLEPHVVLRLMSLDQVHLENQGLELRINDDPLDIRDARHELLGSFLVSG